MSALGASRAQGRDGTGWLCRIARVNAVWRLHVHHRRSSDPRNTSQRLQLHLSQGVRAVESEIVQTPEGMCVRIPDDVAQRYHLEPGVQVELNPVEEGIFFRPMGVESWFSVEWERALEAVLERYRPALENINE